MSLWFSRDSRFHRLDLCGAWRGLDCFLCCPGPSLAGVRDADLHVPGAAVIAVNTAYPRIRPDIWIGMDRPECYAPTLLAEPFLKVMGSRYADDSCAAGRLKDCPNVCFAQGAAGRPHEMFDRLQPDSLLLWNGNTFQTALHLAFRLGCRRVNLVGCDFGGAKDYCDGRPLADGHRRRNRELYRQLVDELPMVRLEAEKRGLEIVSCTPDSPANEYLTFRPLTDAIALAARHVPAQPPGRLLDAAEAELCRWLPCTAPTPGVMTGCDAAQEWMLPWWWDNYSRHNRYPVAFADLGLSPAARAWCAGRGQVVPVDTTYARGWFAKPLAILRSPFRWTLWLDADCEVRADVGEALAYADRGLAVTLDPYYPWRGTAFPGCANRSPAGAGWKACPTADPAVSTGMVAARHGDPAVGMWAAHVLRNRERLRDDQMALEEVREVCRERIVLMPRRLQRLRLDGEADGHSDALVMHWTGDDGKRLIREQLRTDAACGEHGRAGDAGDRKEQREQRQTERDMDHAR